MNLLLDIGNTRIKWCVEQNEELGNESAIIHQQTDFILQIQSAWLELETPSILAISSVTNKQIVDQLTALAETLWPTIKVLLAKSSDQGFSVTNAYPQANKLGVDRWLGLIALQHYYPGNSCIIDCGTAITIDVINHQGRHLGGVICPGLQLMKQALSAGTEALGHSWKHYDVGLANATESAIYTGTLYAAAGLIEKSIADFCSCQTIVLTGGDAELISSYLNLDCIIDPRFILKGLSLYCKEGEIK